jgi:hypothetical protein
MADAAAFDGDLDLLVAKRARGVFKRLERLFCAERGEGFMGVVMSLGFCG